MSIEATTTIDELIEPCRKAEGGDRELDEAIMALFYTREERHIGAWIESDFGPDEPVKEWVWVDPNTDKWRSTHASQFTASLDAITALIEKELPGWSWGVGNASDNAPNRFAAQVRRMGIIEPDDQYHFAPTAPLALCLAFLLARKAIGEQP